MSNHDKFILLVQTGVLLREALLPRGLGVKVLARALGLPDWMPRLEDLRRCDPDFAVALAMVAEEFVAWNYGEADQPPWIRPDFQSQSQTPSQPRSA